MYNFVMRIALGADHAGVALKAHVKQALDDRCLTYEDFGADSEAPVDYPDYALRVARRVASGSFDRGILICGSGLGMAIAANKVQGVRAAPATDAETARLSREHNDANILTLGARLLSSDRVLDIIDAFLSTPFGGGRHKRRVDKISAIETDQDPGVDGRPERTR